MRLDMKFCYAGRNETYALRQLFYRLKMGDVQSTFNEINERLIKRRILFHLFFILRILSKKLVKRPIKDDIRN